ncbi:MAG: hypothetical protein C0622_01650, partial [Desulfuromonas sp.]
MTMKRSPSPLEHDRSDSDPREKKARQQISVEPFGTHECSRVLLQESSRLYALCPNMVSEHLAEEPILRIASLALADLKTAVELATVTLLLKKLYKYVKAEQEEHARGQLIDMIASADPALFFPFCRHPQLMEAEAKEFYRRMKRALNRRVPNRLEAVQWICAYVTRRLLGDQTSCSPLLLGKPGCGKSELATQAAEAMAEAGISAQAIFQPLTQDDSFRVDNSGAMRLLGTSFHYSNGKPGSLYDAVSKPETGVGLVLLDEADKTSFRDYLIGLLDPKTPLADNFIRELWTQMDMRSKSLMLLTANDPAPLNRGPDDPLWSRLDPVRLPAYTPAEMIELAVTL